MARRGRKRRGFGKKSKAIPILPTVVAVMPAYKAYQINGFSKDLPDQLVYQYTGYSTVRNDWQAQPAVNLLGGMIVAVVGHKIANKVGINRTLRKLTGGYLVL
jgi:hypothetical protein